MVLKKVLFEVLKTAAMVAQHTDSAGSESTVSLSLSHWYPGSGVVLDCIDS